MHRISGPNTWQEWSREGRRSYPMLPRVAPQTALALIANNVATETNSENAKLPYPTDTAAAAAENANAVNAIDGRDSLAPWEIKREVYVVTDDPVSFKYMFVCVYGCVNVWNYIMLKE